MSALGVCVSRSTTLTSTGLAQRRTAALTAASAYQIDHATATASCIHRRHSPRASPGPKSRPRCAVTTQLGASRGDSRAPNRFVQLPLNSIPQLKHTKPPTRPCRPRKSRPRRRSAAPRSTNGGARSSISPPPRRRLTREMTRDAAAAARRARRTRRVRSCLSADVAPPEARALVVVNATSIDADGNVWGTLPGWRGCRG